MKNDAFFHVVLPILGGKGGFGSMLRAIGAQIEKTTNREACRDLSGRRLRDVNEEKRVKDWIKKQAQKNEEQKRKKKEKLKRLAGMTATTSYQYNDPDYEKTRAEIPDIIEDSIVYGLKQNSKQTETQASKRKADVFENDEYQDQINNVENSKRANNNEKKSIEKRTLWLGLELDSDDSDDDNGDRDESKDQNTQSEMSNQIIEEKNMTPT